MFLDFYGLKEQPFGVTPDPKYTFCSSSHREALASIYYGIECERGFAALIAPPGMGKTTLLFHLLERLRGSSRTAFLSQTQCNSEEFLRYLMTDLGCRVGGKDQVALHGKLNEILVKEARAGKRFVLIIDEAQNLEDSVLESIRLLSDFEIPSRKLMQIVLAGQTQFGWKLARHELLQLRQRISIVSQIEPLTLPEVGDYIEYRLRVAGHQGVSPFTGEALALIHRCSEGIPRAVNNLCFNALSLGYAQRRTRIDASIVRAVISDRDLIEPSREDLLRPMNRVSGSRLAAAVALLVLAGSLSFSQRPHASLVSTPKPAPAPDPVSHFTVTVGKNETLGVLSRKYLGRNLDRKLSDEILKLNPEIKDPKQIAPGTRLLLPAGSSPSKSLPPGGTRSTSSGSARQAAHP